MKQKYHSRTAKGIYRIGPDNKKLLIGMAFYDKYYEKLTHYDLMASVFSTFIRNM